MRNPGGAEKDGPRWDTSEPGREGDTLEISQSLRAERPDGRAGGRDLDFSRAVLEDLYRYPRKRRGIAFALWATTGLMGGHRFYLDRPATGLLMMFTIGGAGFWWFIDLFLIKRMARRFNEEQLQRQATGLPPRSLAFMPPLRGATLPPFPDWVAKRGGRARLIGDLIVVLTAGVGMGAITRTSGNPEPIIAVLALIAITNLGARWDALATIPALRGFDRWSHRLRLFYYTNDPGGPLRLAFRPIFGFVTALFRRRARAEARLYMQLGAWFTILFTLLDVIQASGIGTSDGISMRGFFGALVFTFASVYVVAAPIGAILTTHVILQRRDVIVWIISAVSVLAILVGFIGGG